MKKNVNFHAARTLVSRGMKGVLNYRSRIKNERGNSFLMYFLLMPVLVMTMGFGMQVSINQYIKTTLQSSLDQGTQSAVSLAVNGGAGNKNVSISEGVASTARVVYDLNRTQKVGGFICDKNAPKTGGTVIKPASGCNWVETSWTVTYKNGQPYLRMEVREQSKNIWGSIFGSSYQEYNLISEARITRSTG